MPLSPGGTDFGTCRFLRATARLDVWSVPARSDAKEQIMDTTTDSPDRDARAVESRAAGSPEATSPWRTFPRQLPEARAATAEIVVGLDESPAALAALRWAAQHARLRGMNLRAVYAHGARKPMPVWNPGMPVAGYLLGEAGDGSGPAGPDVRAYFASVDPERGWSLQFVQDAPGAALVRNSLHAELLVVGTQEHVGLGRLLVGSVSHYCLSHASCPVVAVPWLGGSLDLQDAADSVGATSG